MASPPTLSARAAAALAGFPVAAALAPASGGGRGLVASVAVRAGAVLLREAPLLAAPAPAAAGAVCGQCVRPLGPPPPPGPPPTAHARPVFCGARCEGAAAADGWLTASRGARSFPALAAAARGDRFPPLVAKALGRRLASLLLPGEVDAGASGDADAALASLARPNVPSIPPPWLDLHAAFTRDAHVWLTAGLGVDARAANSILAAHAPAPAFAAILGAVHVNAFRVDCTWPGVGVGEAADGAAASAALLDAALASVAGGASAPGAGTAVYAGASLVNHSCLPTAEPVFDGGELTLLAATDLSPGDAVEICYVDETAPLATRRAVLEEAYGFVCGCVRCVDEASGG
jgi:hypothetical protein